MLFIGINNIVSAQNCSGPFEVDLSSNEEHTIDEVLYQLGISTLDELCNYDEQYSMVIGGTLFLDKPGEEICFDGINIKMLEGADIMVRNYTTLSLNGVQIFGCGTMWRHIDGGGYSTINVTYSAIEDARTAIIVGNHSSVNLHNSTFNNNDNSVFVGHSDSNDNHDNISVSGCTFSSDANYLGNGLPSSGITLNYEEYQNLSPQAGEVNVFDNLASGIVAWHTTIRVNNCLFKNIRGSNSFDYGVFIHRAKALSRVSNNIFENSDNGLKSRYSRIEARNNEMYDVEKGIIVIGSSNILLEQNEIHASSNGIQISSCDRYPSYADFEAIDNEIEIIGNNSAAKAISIYSSDEFIAKENDITLHSNDAGIYVSGSDNTTIEENSITVQGFAGVNTDAIHLENSGFADVTYNDMEDYGPGCNGENIGIFADGSFGTFACNITHDFKKGINFYTECDNSRLDGNRFYDNARDLVLGDAVISSTTVIGKQGDFDEYKGWGNRWLSDNGGSAYNYSPSDYVDDSKFLVNSNVGAMYKPENIVAASDDWFLDDPNATNESSCSYLPDVSDPPLGPGMLDCEDIIKKILKIDTSKVFGDCEKAIWEYHYFKKLLILKKNNLLEGDCLGFYNENSDSVLLQIAKVDSAIANILINQSVDTVLYNGITDTQEELDNLFDQGEYNTPVWKETMEQYNELTQEYGVLMQEEKESDIQKADSVQNVIGEIVVNDSCLHILLKTFNIKLDYIKSDTLTPAQNDYITEVSELCPNEYGDGVYLARAMRSMYENVRYASPEECYSGNIEPRSASNLHLVDKLEVYPNPAIDEVNISLDIPKGEAGRLSVVNLQGQKIKEFIANKARSSFKINTKGFESGIYIVKYISDAGSLSVKKLIIDK